MVDDSEIRDEPSYLLSRATDLFRQRREKLLDGDDLLYLWENREALDSISTESCVLLVQSALRRPPTLFFWLARCGFESADIVSVLEQALDMRDRDKSDMGKMVPLVAALYLDRTQYDGLIARMADSAYAHIREAAAEFEYVEDAEAAIETRRASRIDGQPLADLDNTELLAAADELALPENRRTASRRMPNLGLEYLARKLGA